MSEQLYVCDGAGKCPIASDCTCGEPHMLAGWCYECGRESEGGILGAKCVPVASPETTDTKSPVATERCTSDPDAVIARRVANDDDVVCDWSIIKPLLLRLADKVEGK